MLTEGFGAAESRAAPSLGWQRGPSLGATIALALLGAGSRGCSGSREDARGQRGGTDPNSQLSGTTVAASRCRLEAGEGSGMGLVGWGCSLSRSGCRCFWGAGCSNASGAAVGR